MPKILSINENIILVKGLQEITLGGVVKIGNYIGIITNFSKGLAYILLDAVFPKVSLTDTVSLLSSGWKVKVSRDQIGHIINSKGDVIDANINISQKYDLYPFASTQKTSPKNIITGIHVIDKFFPIINGDNVIFSNTNSIITQLLDTSIINNVDLLIIPLIDKSRAYLNALVYKLKELQILNKTIIIYEGRLSSNLSKYYAYLLSIKLSELINLQNILVLYDDLNNYINNAKDIFKQYDKNYSGNIENILNIILGHNNITKIIRLKEINDFVLSRSDIIFYSTDNNNLLEIDKDNTIYKRISKKNIQ